MGGERQRGEEERGKERKKGRKGKGYQGVDRAFTMSAVRSCWGASKAPPHPSVENKTQVTWGCPAPSPKHEAARGLPAWWSSCGGEVDDG